jgi:hypothetical protein
LTKEKEAASGHLTLQPAIAEFGSARGNIDSRGQIASPVPGGGPPDRAKISELLARAVVTGRQGRHTARRFATVEITFRPRHPAPLA